MHPLAEAMDLWAIDDGEEGEPRKQKPIKRCLLCGVRLGKYGRRWCGACAHETRKTRALKAEVARKEAGRTGLGI